MRKSKRAWPGVALLVAIGGAMCWVFLAAPPVEDQFRQLQACPSSEVTEVRIYDFDSAYSGSSPSFVKRGAETARFLEMIANAERASPNRSRGASTLLFAEVDTKRLGTMYLSMSATEHCGVLVSLRSKGVADHGSYWSTAPFRNDELIAVFSEYAHVRRAARRP